MEVRIADNMTGTLECITHPHPSPSNMVVAVDGVKSCHDGQDEHNRLGADGDICLPFEMSPVGYSDALQQSLVIGISTQC